MVLIWYYHGIQALTSIKNTFSRYILWQLVMASQFGKTIPPQDPSVKEIDAGVKNKFKWTWLQESCIVDGHTLSLDCYSKVSLPGKVLCTVCNDTINYATSGKKALLNHVRLAKHVKAWKVQQQNMQITISPVENTMVAVPPENSKRIVPLCDRVANSQVKQYFCFPLL